MSSKAYYSNNVGTSGSTKYGKRKRSLESGSSIVYTGSSVGSVKDKKFNASIGKPIAVISNQPYFIRLTNNLDLHILYYNMSYVLRRNYLLGV